MLVFFKCFQRNKNLKQPMSTPWIAAFLLFLLFLLVVVLVLTRTTTMDHFEPQHTLNPSPLNPTTNCDVIDSIVKRVNTILNGMFPPQSPVGDIQVSTGGEMYVVPSSDLQFTAPSFSVSLANQPGSTTFVMNPNGSTATIVGAANTWQQFQVMLPGSPQPLFYNQSGRFYVDVFDRAGYPVCSNSFTYVENALTGAMTVQHFSSMTFSIPPPTACTILASKQGTKEEVNFTWSIENTDLTLSIDFQFFACMLGTGWCETKSGNPFSSGFYECNDTQPACPHDQVCDAPIEPSGKLTTTFHLSIPGTGSFVATKNIEQKTLDISNIQLSIGNATAIITAFSFQMSTSVQQSIANDVKPYLQNALQTEVANIFTAFTPKIVHLLNQSLQGETISFST